ncbi:MAG: hypothetical protein HKN44_13290, partial [Ilumatobacter sp.]|nr:hypothetical protein [Ilumatobacter sp.]
AGNEANFFIRDATNGSTLPFRLFPTAPSNSLTIQGDGDIGVGTNNPGGSAAVTDVQLEVTGLALTTGATSGVAIQSRSGGNVEWTMASLNDTDGLIFDESGVGQSLRIKNGGGIQLLGGAPTVVNVGSLWTSASNALCFNDGSTTQKISTGVGSCP